jgi:hypothetical protein
MELINGCGVLKRRKGGVRLRQQKDIAHHGMVAKGIATYNYLLEDGRPANKLLIYTSWASKASAFASYGEK